MSAFNDSYDRLHQKWAYGADGWVGPDGWWIDYNVEKQLEDWATLYAEYTKLSKALDKASDILYELNDCYNLRAENFARCPFYDYCESIDKCIASPEKWKEWLLTDGIKQK